MAGTDSPPPRVSVVLPVFDCARHVAEAVESVLSQTLADLELVLVDDGSRDGTADILERFARADPRVKLLTHATNLGIATALNDGWRLARSPYIARLDADDAALPDRLSRQVEFLDSHPGVAAVGSAMIVIDEHGTHLQTRRFPGSSRAIHEELLRSCCMAHPSVMLRRSALEAVGGYRFDPSEDYDLWLRLSERFELANLPEPLILHRVHLPELSLGAFEEHIRQGICVRDAAVARRASRADPLAGVSRLTPAVVERFQLDDAEVSHRLEQRALLWATVLAQLGRGDEADELIERASRLLGPGTSRSFAAAREFNRAAKLLAGHRPLAGIARVAVAFRREPRYACSRVTTWLRDRFHARRFLASS